MPPHLFSFQLIVWEWIFILRYIIEKSISCKFPAYKNCRKRSDNGNYRPGSLLYPDHQYRLQVSRFTADLLAVLTKHVYRLMDVGGQTRTMILDISKAFDTMLHAFGMN